MWLNKPKFRWKSFISTATATYNFYFSVYSSYLLKLCIVEFEYDDKFDYENVTK